ncbi:serine hydrolase domain-containing protein [Streptomyces sp. NPDC002490]|uniref:serine hydrolase domain-containing protein n=1 Tax=Streptomyces sp. NPDC002490 TaxID=3154416 RepID=UPI00332E9A22
MQTRRRTRRTLVALGLVTATLAGTAGAAQAGPADPGTERRQGGHAVTQRAMDSLVAGGVPGITGQARDERGAWAGTSGIGNLKTGAPRGAEDRFRIASVTKTFVATVLLQMESEGRLDLDDTVDRHLPGLVRGNGHDGRLMTVRQLLNHTSGVFNYDEDPAYAEKYHFVPGFLKHRYDTRTPEEAVRVALRHAPHHQPGQGWHYSNTNYVLAGLIIEKVGGRTYEREVRDRIVKPLGLKETTLPGNSSRMPQPSSRAYSKMSPDPAATRIYDVTLNNASQSWADGDIISTAADLNRFFGALLGGKLLAPAQLAAMKTTVPVEGSFPGTGYGLGLIRSTTSCGTKLWGHGGGWYGSLTGVYSTEDGRHGLAYNLNGDWYRGQANAISEAEFCGVEPTRAAGGASASEDAPRTPGNR